MPDTLSLTDRVQRAECWAVGLYAFAIFFILGAIISILNGDIMRTLGGLLLAALTLGGGIGMARRNAGGERRRG